VGLHLGFGDMLRARMIARMPRLAAIQASGCDPIYRAWKDECADIPAVEKQPTVAEGISVAKPVRGKDILEAIRESGGVARTVIDDEIWESVDALGRKGIYIEPTAAAAPAALAGLRCDGIISKRDRVVVMLTGSGLKATDKIV